VLKFEENFANTPYMWQPGSITHCL